MGRARADGTRVRVLAWGCVALWTALIFGLSTDSFSADQTSGIIGPLLDFFFPGLDAGTRALVHFLVRKLAHFVEYAVLGILSWRALRMGEPWSALRTGAPRSELRSAALAVAFLLAVAALDETGQATRASRTGSPRDVALDTAGGITGVCLALGVRALGRRRAALSFPRPPVP
jgi:VanZ family protein